MKKLRYDLELNAKDIWLFSMYHVNRGGLLAFNVIFTVIMYIYMVKYWGSFDISRRILFLVLSNIFLIIQPIQLYLKALKQSRSDVIKNGVTLEFDDVGIDVRQNEISATFNWDLMLRSRVVPGMIIIYVDRMRAYLIPKRYFEHNKDELISILKEKTRLSRF